MVAKRVILIVVVIVVDIVVLYCHLSQLQDAKSRKLTQIANQVKLVLQSSHFGASYNSSNLSSLSPNRSPLCIVYFTTKTTPKNYDKRIHPLKMSWFQQVYIPEMVSQ